MQQAALLVLSKRLPQHLNMQQVTCPPACGMSGPHLACIPRYHMFMFVGLHLSHGRHLASTQWSSCDAFEAVRMSQSGQSVVSTP